MDHLRRPDNCLRLRLKTGTETDARVWSNISGWIQMVAHLNRVVRRYAAFPTLQRVDQRGNTFAATCGSGVRRRALTPGDGAVRLGSIVGTMRLPLCGGSQICRCRQKEYGVAECRCVIPVGSSLHA